MPTYNLRNNITNEEFEQFMSMTELDEFLKLNPNIEQIPTKLNIVGGVDGIRKPDDGFRDLLKEMKKTHKKGDFGQLSN